MCIKEKRWKDAQMHKKEMPFPVPEAPSWALPWTGVSPPSPNWVYNKPDNNRQEESARVE